MNSVIQFNFTDMFNPSRHGYYIKLVSKMTSLIFALPVYLAVN